MFEETHALHLAAPQMSARRLRNRCENFGEGVIEILYDQSIPEHATQTQQHETIQPADEMSRFM